MAVKANGKKWHAIAPEPFGAFHLHELINKGGLCEIWTATDVEGHHFAIRKMHKQLKGGFFSKSQEEKTFLNGCEILQKVHDHPYVIDYIEHGKINKIPYMLMHYVEEVRGIENVTPAGDEDEFKLSFDPPDNPHVSI